MLRIVPYHKALAITLSVPFKYTVEYLLQFNCALETTVNVNYHMDAIETHPKDLWNQMFYHRETETTNLQIYGSSQIKAFFVDWMDNYAIVKHRCLEV